MERGKLECWVDILTNSQNSTFPPDVREYHPLLTDIPTHSLPMIVIDLDRTSRCPRSKSSKYVWSFGRRRTCHLRTPSKVSELKKMLTVSIHSDYDHLVFLHRRHVGSLREVLARRLWSSRDWYALALQEGQGILQLAYAFRRRTRYDITMIYDSHRANDLSCTEYFSPWSTNALTILVYCSAFSQATTVVQWSSLTSICSCGTATSSNGTTAPAKVKSMKAT